MKNQSFKTTILGLVSTVLLALSVQAQTLYGTVSAVDGERLPGANIIIMGTSTGTITDSEGSFQISVGINNPNTVIASFVGYQPDTLAYVEDLPLSFILKPNRELEEIQITADAATVDFIAPQQTEIISSKELLKAACCNLSESFETNASVDVSVADAVSGAKKIQFLGLSGRYVQIQRENILNIRGLMGNQGLQFIPGPWIQSIDVGKGAGSVVNGYESMTGQLNIELIKPENSAPFYFNTYANSLGRTEANLNFAKKLNEKWSTGLLMHGSFLASEIDQNDDGFMDLPQYRQANILHRWKYNGERLKSQFGVNVLKDESLGGQVGASWDDNPAMSTRFTTQSDTERIEVFGKAGLIFPKSPYRGLGFVYSASHYNHQANYGRRTYEGRQRTAYANLIYQSIIGNTNHQFKTGLSFLLDDYQEHLNDSAFARQEAVPGVYVEYTESSIRNLKLVIGGRADRHNLYGTFFTPRLHARYQIVENTVLRASAGRGFRVANVIAENNSFLFSNRQFQLREPVDPEISWNMGFNIQHEFSIAERPAQFIIDFYRTTFENQAIIDFDTNPGAMLVYNLIGQSYANSYQAEWHFKPVDRLAIKLAYKHYDVQMDINGQTRRQPFVPNNRFFANIGYTTPHEIWTFDLTAQWYGQQRIPDTNEKSPGFALASQSPAYMTINAQIAKRYRKWAWYLGGENLGNFKQDNPIIAPDEPFGNNFDGSLVWGPIVGRIIYAGVRIPVL